MTKKRWSIAILATMAMIMSLLAILLLGGVESRAASAEEVVTKDVDGVLYNPELDKGYGLSNQVSQTVFGATHYVDVSVRGEYTETTYNGVSAFAVTGSSAPKIYLKVRYDAGVDQAINNSEWKLCNDSWGNYENETINDVKRTGQVGSGAIIVQKSYDKNFSGEDTSRYANGLYTTDFYYHYGTNDTFIYSPSGEDLNKGVYIRVLYAYEVYHNYTYHWTTEEREWYQYLLFGIPLGGTHTVDHYENRTEYQNYIESYTFFLASNSTEAVTFKNLSLTDKFPEELLGADGDSWEIYKQGETIQSGGGTVTGFRVDVTKNPYLTVTMKKNDQAVDYKAYPYVADDRGKGYNVTETGRYDITVKTIFGNTKTTTIYVDRSSQTEAFERYFGADRLLGQSKRVFPFYPEGIELEDESMLYPTYEAGNTFYSLPAVEPYYLPLYGEIVNYSTNKTIRIEPNTEERKGELNEAGEYIATFKTNPSFETDAASGDNMVFMFRFRLIPEGSSPNPWVNKRNLDNYAYTNVADYLPYYYGLTYHSAGAGDITVAFPTEKAAFDYAYVQEKGSVIVEEDGTYRYKGQLAVTQKEQYNSNWDLMDAINYFARQSIQRLYFDASYAPSFRTLQDDVSKTVSNLKTLELQYDVVVFPTNVDRTQYADKGQLPIINPKNYEYVTYSDETHLYSKIISGKNDFVFVRDENGYDSDSIEMIDAEGHHFSIDYGIGVGQQLIDKGCVSGLVHCIERNVYDDVAEYDLIFIAPGENTTELTIEWIDSDQTQERNIGQGNLPEDTIRANVFSFTSANDDLDSYALIKVVVDHKTQEQRYYTLEEIQDTMFGEKGFYQFTCINRLGYVYSFSIEIEQPYYIDIEISDGDADSTVLQTHYGEENVALPVLSRIGYNFMGYSDGNGNVYNEEIAKILFKGNMLLTPIWEAKKFNLTFSGTDLAISTMAIEYGVECPLPIPTMPDGLSFVGWSYDGKLLEGNTFTLNAEKDVSLVAQVKKTKATVSLGDYGVKKGEVGDVVSLPSEGGILYWQDADGNQYSDSYVIESLADVNLVAVYGDANKHTLAIVLGSVGGAGLVGGIAAAIWFIVKKRRAL